MKFNITFLCIILLSSVFYSCEEIDYSEQIDGFDVYRIAEGRHSSSSKIRSFTHSILNFDVRFDSTAIYDIGADQSDINKLYGFNDCSNENVHYNSARFGWRWMNDSLDLFSYVYLDGDLLKNKIKNIAIDDVYNCQIEIRDSVYLFSVENIILDTVPRGCSSLDVSRKYLYPYFGGNMPSPHEIVILIKEN